jgi:hypothetical protein
MTKLNPALPKNHLGSRRVDHATAERVEELESRGLRRIPFDDLDAIETAPNKMVARRAADSRSPRSAKPSSGCAIEG